MSLALVRSAAEAFRLLDTDTGIIACTIPLNMNPDLQKLRDAIVTNDLDVRIMDDCPHDGYVQRVRTAFNSESFLPVKFDACEYYGATPMRLDLHATLTLENRAGESFTIAEAFSDDDYGPEVTDFFFRSHLYEGGGNDLHRDRGAYTLSLFAEGDCTVLQLPGYGRVIPKAPCLSIYRGLDHRLTRVTGNQGLAALHQGQPNGQNGCAAVLINIGNRRMPNGF